MSKSNDNGRQQESRGPECPFCDGKVTQFEEPRELELGFVADGECEHGHHAGVMWPKRTNEKIEVVRE